VQPLLQLLEYLAQGRRVRARRAQVQHADVALLRRALQSLHDFAWRKQQRFGKPDTMHAHGVLGDCLRQVARARLLRELNRAEAHGVCLDGVRRRLDARAVAQHLVARENQQRRALLPRKQQAAPQRERRNPLRVDEPRHNRFAACPRLRDLYGI
jgi:hypothetical protein